MYHIDYIQSIESSITSVALPDWICNDTNCTYIDFSHFGCLESLSIGNDSFSFVNTLKIDGLNRLKTIRIGMNSFTQVKGGPWSCIPNKRKSFHILNCESLESIKIGEFSFYDFAGVLELKNLPQLQSIQIGTIGSDSGNFKNSSFVIRGINMILNIQCLDLPNLKSVTLGDRTFEKSFSTRIESNE